MQYLQGTMKGGLPLLKKRPVVNFISQAAHDALATGSDGTPRSETIPNTGWHEGTHTRRLFWDQAAPCSDAGAAERCGRRQLQRLGLGVLSLPCPETR